MTPSPKGLLRLPGRRVAKAALSVTSVLAVTAAVGGGVAAIASGHSLGSPSAQSGHQTLPSGSATTELQMQKVMAISRAGARTANGGAIWVQHTRNRMTRTTPPTSTTSSTTSSTPTSSTTTPSTTAASSSAFPGPASTGIPTGTALSAYTGPCTISSGTVVIDSKDLTNKCPASGQGLYVNGTANVTITKSKFAGVYVESPNARVSIADSEGNGGNQVTYSTITSYPGAGVAAPKPSFMLSLLRVNVHGGRNPLECVASCKVKDSWLHTPYFQQSSGAHQQAILNSGGGSNSNIWIEHNTLSCDGTEGCTADLSLFGDFAVASDVTITGNLFKAHPEAYYYCATFGYNPGKAFPNPDHIVVTNNVFEKGSTGVAGSAAVSSRTSQGKCGQAYSSVSWRRAASGGTGNVWSGNTYDDKSVIAEPATG
ncbi:hypothetical protein BJ986_001862 [Phycicoccus badiiscoriae]|uniref:Pectate lyase n=1 Tax=Pedococcus badiiscoriae TaxID=642776 RepID=A0A852WMA7_9MICO|nr:hypothetical protein [Pedococcus badiiscoriae]NYG07375.1 hypothetical protein [Pedococcus badiiscoriae]